MEAKSIFEERFEEMIVAFIRTTVVMFAEDKEKECFEAHERRGIDIKTEVSDKVLDELSEEVDKNLLGRVINELRLLFNKIINEHDQPFGSVKYMIERYEGSIEKLKSGGRIKKFTLLDLVTNPEIHLDEYLEFLEKAIQKLKFEFEVI